MYGRRLLIGSAAGLAALTAGAGIAAAQSDEDGTDDTVVEQPSTDDTTVPNDTTTDDATRPDDSTSPGDREGCDDGRGAPGQGDQGDAPAGTTAPDSTS
jgi:hypothetical protein